MVMNVMQKDEKVLVPFKKAINALCELLKTDDQPSKEVQIMEAVFRTTVPPSKRVPDEVAKLILIRLMNQ
jgi:hypothetical protein